MAGRYLVEQLRQQHEVTVVASDASAPGDVRLRGFQLPFKAMRRMEFVMAVPRRKILAAAFAQVDIVHLAFPFWLSFVALQEARKAGRPVVSSFHVQPENLYRNVGLNWEWLNRLTYRFWIQRFYNRLDRVICATDFAARKLRQHGLTVPTQVVSNGMPPDLRRIEGARPVESAGRFVICSVGRLAAEKRHEVLIEAVQRSRHRDRIQLVIAGAGPAEQELRARAAGLPVPVQMGFHDREQLSRLLSSADLMVHCGEVELEGIAVIEGMTLGVPVLVAESSESAAAEFALNDSYRFRAGDSAALAARIDALIEDPAELARARAGYAVSAQRFEFSRTVQGFVDAYRTVLA